MAKIERKIFPQIGNGYRIHTQVIPLAGLIPVLKTAREGHKSLYRYSVDGGTNFTNWESLNSAVSENLGRLTDAVDLVLDYVTDPFRRQVAFFRKLEVDPYDVGLNSMIYDKSVFNTFFNSDDPQVLDWALNVLEKLFEPGIVPLYVSRNNENDYGTFFFTITHFFAFVVIYARQFRELENSELLMKEFIEGWGLVYENITTLDQRKYLFKNWLDQFRKRGTPAITETGGVVDGELRRLVGYTKPNEFIFGVLAPQNVGWCMGLSSPTWYGTETVNAVSKGYDFGPDYAGDNYGEIISFGEDELSLPTDGEATPNTIITKHSWEIYLEGDENLPTNLLQAANIGVESLSDYPILGDVERVYQDDIYVFKFKGTGRVGISSEADTTKVMEVYRGLDYEITVWLKADQAGDVGSVQPPQNIEFGVNCYDSSMNLIKQVRLTDLEVTNSFFLGERYQSPCKVPGVYYQLRGIIYNVDKDTDENRDLYLNFENGRPLKFFYSDNGAFASYMAPYIVQNRDGNVADLSVAGIVLKPLDLPFSQGYLGQKNVIAMYAQIRSARTKQDIEEFIKRYLVSYKNIVSYTWLDWVTRKSWILTFIVSNVDNGDKVDGAAVTLSTGVTAYTDYNGYVRFELPLDSPIKWTVSYEGVEESGSLTMDKDYTIEVPLKLPLFVEMEIVQPEWGEVKITGQRLGEGWVPRTEVTFTATPNAGYNFVKYIIVTDKTEDTRNPTNYFLGDHDIIVQAVFEIAGSLSFSPDVITLPAAGGSMGLIASSSVKWKLDDINADWVKVTPMSGDAGDNPLTVETI